MADDVGVLANEAQDAVNLGDERLEIRPLVLGQLPAFTNAIRGLIQPFGELLVLIEDKDDTAMVNALLSMLADHGEQMIDAIAVATRAPRDQIAEANLEETLSLIQKVIKVNRDFFDQRLRPAIAEARKSAQAATAKAAGPKSSPSS